MKPTANLLIIRSITVAGGKRSLFLVISKLLTRYVAVIGNVWRSFPLRNPIPGNRVCLSKAVIALTERNLYLQVEYLSRILNLLDSFDEL